MASAYSNSGHDAYLESRVLTADPIELVNMLYLAGLQAVREARQHLAEHRIAERSRAINQACQIVIELAVSLDHERGGEISQRLALLYDYMQRRLLEANIKQADEPLADVLGLLTTLTEAWAGVRSSEIKSEPAAEIPWSEPAPEIPWSEPAARNPWSEPGTASSWSPPAAENAWSEPVASEPVAANAWSQPGTASSWSEPVAEAPWSQPAAQSPWSTPEARFSALPLAAENCELKPVENPWLPAEAETSWPEPSQESPWLQSASEAEGPWSRAAAPSPWSQPATEEVGSGAQGWSL
jgi:flagellar secretion chaperone FliS